MHLAIRYFFLLVAFGFGFTFAATRCSSTEIPNGTVSFVNLDGSGLLEVIKLKFPEKKPPDSSVILDTDYVYTMTDTGHLKITFLNSGGSIRSSLGYYKANINFKALNIEVLFPDQTCARVGDVVTIGPFPKWTQIGFTITSPQNTTDRGIINATYWSHPSKFDKNSDDTSHVAILEVNGKILIGFEDMFGGGDKDFNDVIVSIDIVPDNCNSPCPENYLTCCNGSLLNADFGKIFGLATGLGLVVERILEIIWSLFNLPTFDYNPGTLPGGARNIPSFTTQPTGPNWRFTILRSEMADIQYDELKAAIAVYQERAKTARTPGAPGALAAPGAPDSHLQHLLACVNWKSKFEAAASRELSFRLIISFICSVGLGIGFSFLANLMFVLCWCWVWAVGIGIFAGILSPFVHQFFELTFRLQRYLKQDST